ncbi:hypothetical protein R5H30_14305 [Sulfitobacter sp. D35]|uniref:hypothetical protein n=1 Tax=Sulfitobacter sp. D35 TaxID=3083252 RepID=UPI00296F1F45|nr:hypothetical protein [Sulfitobacter sp. D35]MDW4499163.1 hypothetical protein [Sulfitobacter sp. D35]
MAGVHIDFAWAVRVWTEAARELGVDLFLLDSNGSVVAASSDAAPDLAELQILRAASTGVAAQGRETWPDGRDYFSSLVPRISYEDLPNFGWRLLARLDADAFRPDLSSLRAALSWTVLAMLLVLIVLTAAFILFFIRPIEDLAEKSDRIAEGEDIYPPEHRRTRETALLSSAVARLQNPGSVNSNRN